jgi:chemotaxis signal transduction protein
MEKRKKEFLTFVLENSDILYGIRLKSLLEIIKYDVVYITPIAIAENSIIAVINFNGEAIPVFDIASKLKFITKSRITDKSSLLVIQGEIYKFALLVDEVRAIETDIDNIKIIESDEFSI